MNCPNCASPTGGGQFCTSCGHKLPDAAATQVLGTGPGPGRDGRSTLPLVIAAVVTLLAVIAGGVAFALTREDDKEGALAVTSPSPSPYEYVVPTPSLYEEPVPEYSPEPEPVPEVVEEPSCSSKQLSFTVVEQGFSFLQSDNYKYVSYAVVVKNADTVCATSGVNVTVDFMNASGGVITTETVPLGSVRPGGTAAVSDTTFVDEKPTRMEFGAQTTSGEDAAPGGVQVSNVRQIKDSYLGTRFTGRLRSTVAEPITVRVGIVVRRHGKVIGGAFTYRDLPHDGTGAFEASTTVTIPTGVPSAYVTW